MLQTSPRQTIKPQEITNKNSCNNSWPATPTQPPPPDSASSLRAPHWAEDVSAWPGETLKLSVLPLMAESFGDSWDVLYNFGNKVKWNPLQNGGFER